LAANGAMNLMGQHHYNQDKIRVRTIRELAANGAMNLMGHHHYNQDKIRAGTIRELSIF
jgi:hypothetical protein